MSLSSHATPSSASTATAAPMVVPPKLNRKWVLKRRPTGVFDPKLDVELLEDTAAADNVLTDTQVEIEPQLLSVDAFLRTMCDEHAYHGCIPLGGSFPAIGYGTVVKAGSKSGHKVGSVVAGMLAAADKCVVEGKQVMTSMRFPFLKRSDSLGLVGLTCGLTAYCGVFYVPSRIPQKGETVVVTGAAGAVGSIAVQLCLSRGARVVGVAGGPVKAAFLQNELKCDGVIDYKDTANRSLAEQISATCPNGIDFIYDNVGGCILDALLYQINPKARVVICGAISQYSGNLHNGSKQEHICGAQGPSNYLKLAERGAEMRGFNVMQYIWRLPFMLVGMMVLWAKGKVVMTEHVEEGLEQFPVALQKLFTGETIGKTLVRIRPDDQ